jgi:type IX secretion system PorP/SprF family membrane protein
MGFDGAPTTFLGSFHTNLVANKIGFGLTVSNYEIGIVNSWVGAMAYSYRIEFEEKIDLRLGLHAMIKSQRFNFEDLVSETGGVPTNDMGVIGSQENNLTADFGFGAYLNLDKVYVGLSVPYLVPNDVSFDELSSTSNITRVASFRELPHVYFMTGGAFPISDDLSLQPNLLAKYVQGAPFDLDVSLALGIKDIVATGLTYRLGGEGSGESIDFLLYLMIQNLGLGVSYDYPLTDIQTQSSGSIEAVVKYIFLSKEQGNMSNPRFFF